jgi:hypothetical protein
MNGVALGKAKSKSKKVKIKNVATFTGIRAWQWQG